MNVLVLPVRLAFFLSEVLLAYLLDDQLVTMVVDSESVVGLRGLVDVVEDLEPDSADLEL